MLERTLGSSSSVATILLAFYPHHHHHHHHQHQYTFSPQNVTRYSPHLLRCKPPSCSKMFVPGFGEASPEAKAATNLHNFFTFLAVKIVLAQLQSYNPEAYEELMEFTSRNSLSDGDKYCANLMRESPRLQTIALRILEVRSAYCKNDFEWDNLKRLAFTMIDESNTRIMRDYVLETSHVENEK
ncbi:chaperonin-like RBCX protein 1, chloroplastic isoform X1 [Magnolia sinica]|uniref:chaperonin-like RBCX protein 1, chloroplastic isoform X1 n=1 Tax=Magnolia sinica TaxID=86752 RepID=UPI00265AC416|nr:chaperonin-like RBCX protein 1, chloroplastic isoform X1 [Magnolia sinica]